MAYLYSCTSRAYYLEDEIGYIKNGIFHPVEYVEEEFGKVVEQVIDSKRAATVTAVLRKAILVYMLKRNVQVVRLEKKFQKTNLSHSSLYQKWSEYVSNSQKFKVNQIYALIAQKQQQEQIRKAKEEKRIASMHHHE